MRHVQSSDAAARFADCLADVEQGETVVIVREGRPIARLSPESPASEWRCLTADERRARVDAFQEKVRAIRQGQPKVSLAEILEWRHEGQDEAVAQHSGGSKYAMS